MHGRTLTIVLALGLLLSGLSLLRLLATVHLPGNDQGYGPRQPIAYSHRLHAGDLEIPCLYCHSGAEKSRHAGVPSASVCMNCHRFVTAPMIDVRAEERRADAEGRKPALVVSPELRKLYDAVGFGADLRLDPTIEPRAIEWVRVHRVPDFVYFDHRPHVAAGIDCRRCHGAVEMMERVEQQESLSMGWCLSCHRTEHQQVDGRPMSASTDCSACHY